LTDEIAFLASLFSFGVLAAFTAAQLAVIRLRFTEPELARPYRAPFNVRLHGVEVPLPAVVGSVLTLAVFVIALITHAGARYGGPVWLVAGLAVYGLVRRQRGQGPLDRQRDRQGGRAERRRPDRRRLGTALAPPVALLLADGRIHPPQGAV